MKKTIAIYLVAACAHSKRVLAVFSIKMLALLLPGMLVACGSVSMSTHAVALPQTTSRWIAVDWSDLPGFGEDALFEAWNAWLKSCEKPQAPFTALCGDVRRLSIASTQEQRDWMVDRLQPYRVESAQGDAVGLLTGYFEPALEASRIAGPDFSVPMYQMPVVQSTRKPWFTRQEIDTLPEAQAALQGRTIAYLADPVDALILQIQGSGRIHLTQADGSKVWVRVAYAGTNDQPYRSVGRWLLDQGLIRDASWPGIKAWLAQNPQRQQELLWSNPRVVFFKEEVLSELDASFGPRGAQGVALTPGRSIAVDPGSIPYGTPLWLASSGGQLTLQKLVLAQDTGSAITGAVRADYFAGWGAEAGELAGRLKQPLQLWVLWPK
jgi:membrane-bound lytic murein transglycosylase A